MQSINWRGSRLCIQSHTVKSGDNQLELRRCYREGTQTGAQVLMLPDFLETTDVFLPSQAEAGLAPFLASLGYDIYLAELRGKGRSWPAAGRGADWGSRALFEEDLPAHIRKMNDLRPGANAFWLGHGFGSLLLMAAWLRFQSRPALLGMVHVSAARRPERKDRLIHSPLTPLRALIHGYIRPSFDKAGRRESRQTCRDWQRWQEMESWSDVDFDYREALQAAALPASLYLANLQARQAGNITDCRRWISELPSHDGRLIGIGKQGGNLRNYSRRELLLHPQACEDHFPQVGEWMQGIEARSETPSRAA